MKRKHKRYDEDFKRKAVEQLNATNNAKALASKLGVAPSQLYQWRTNLNASSKKKPNGKGNGHRVAQNGHAPAGGADCVSFYVREMYRIMPKQLAAGKADAEDPIYMLAKLAFLAQEGHT
jgi:hypothetical protein